jgi:hypothetical protein
MHNLFKMVHSTTQKEPANTVPARRKEARKSLPSSSKKQETRAVNPKRKTRKDSTRSLPMATEINTADGAGVSETKLHRLAVKSEPKKSKDSVMYMCDGDKESPEVNIKGKTASKARVHREKKKMKAREMATSSKTEPEENSKETAEPNSCAEECIEVVDAVTGTGKRITRILSPKRLKVAPANKAQQKKVRLVEMVAQGAGWRKKRTDGGFFRGAPVTLTPTTQERTRE